MLALIAADLPAAAQDIPLRDWRQIDTGGPRDNRVVWRADARAVRVLGAPGSGEIGAGFRSFCVAGGVDLTEAAFRCSFTREALYDHEGLARAPFGVVFRWRDTDNYYALRFTGDDELRLERRLKGVATDLAAIPGYAPIGIETYIDIQLLGAQIRVRLNGRLIIAATDDALAGDHVGFFVDRGTRIRFERIALYPSATAPFLYVPLLMVKLPYVLHTGANEATVLWETNRPVSADITYGPPGNEEQFTVAASANGCLRQITLTGLAPDTQYVYRVKAEGRTRGGGEFHTQALSDEPFVVGFIGDTKTYPERFKDFAGMLLRRRPNFVVHLGDIVNRATRLDEWDEFYFKPGEALLGRVPTYVAAGNHDQHPDRHWFNTYLPYPGTGRERDDRGESAYYAFTYGNAAFAILDNYFPLTPDSAQYTWLEETLRSPEFQDALWRIVCCHEPPYGIGRGHWLPGNAAVRDHVLPLCRDYGVQLLVAGHEHTYKRALIDGVILVVNGGGGCGYGFNVAQRNRIAQFAAQLLGYATLQYSVMRVEGTRLEWTCYNSDNKRIDRFILDEGATWPVTVVR